MSDRLKYRAAAMRSGKPRMIENYICCTLLAGLLILVLLMGLLFTGQALEYDLPPLLM